VAIRRISSIVLGLFFIAAGANHFVHPAFYIGIVPNWLPAHALLVYVSGICEVLGGVGVFVPATRVAAGIGLIVLLCAVFPANVAMAQDPERYAAVAPALALYLRLPLQLGFIAWVWWTTIRKGEARAPKQKRASRT
jgi:uncharacterized membrane protein